MRKFVLLIIAVFSVKVVFTQGQYNKWHFGVYSSIDFNSGSPVALAGSAIYTAEISTSISDATGNLLFYTDGETVYNRNHIVMPNGTGLLGWSDVQQGAIIVPKPGSTNLYYIFTIGNPTGPYTKQFNYSVVDMNLDGGLGDVTTKNFLLDNNVTERLTATWHKNATDFWVVQKNFGTNTFKSYQVSSLGISGPILSPGGAPSTGDFTGAVKISNNGCWLLSTTRQVGRVELFKFNIETGVVSDGSIITSITNPYGIEFSPDNSKFYVGQNSSAPLYQFDLNAGTTSQVLASAIPVTNGGHTAFALQAAPDGKIYFVRFLAGPPETYGNREYNFRTSLAVINNPGLSGTACNVNLDGFSSPLLYNTSSLPNNFNLTFTPQPLSISITSNANSVCAGATVLFNAIGSAPNNTSSFQWKKNGLNVGTNTNTYSDNNLNNGDIINCVITSTGNCVSQSTANSNDIVITVLPKPVVSLDKTTNLCAGSTRQLDAGNFNSYLWNDGSTQSTLLINNIGTYYVNVTDANGCTASDTTKITTILPSPAAFLPPDTSICPNENLELRSLGSYNDYLWNTNAATPSINTSSPGLYWLQVSDNNNCEGRDSILVNPGQCITGFYVPSGFTPNNDGKNDKLTPFLPPNTKQYKFTVYNRWGQIVFQTTEINKGWDGIFKGNNQHSNVFIWMCTYQVEGEKIKMEKGTVMLIR